MTKVRAPASRHRAAHLSIGRFEEAEIKAATGKSVSWLRSCADEDDSREVSFRTAVELSALHVMARHDCPFEDAFGCERDDVVRRLGGVPDHEPADPADRTLTAVAHIGTLVHEINEAKRDRHYSDVEIAAIERAIDRAETELGQLRRDLIATQMNQTATAGLKAVGD